MSLASSERRRFPASMRWSDAGDDLSRRGHRDQCVERPPTRYQRSPKFRFKMSELAVLISSSPRNSLASTSKVGASIKSP